MTMPTDRPRYYCPRYPTSHYDDSPDGYGPCAWCGTDGAHIAPPVECPSCGARVIDRDLKPETMPADPDVTTSAPRPSIVDDPNRHPFWPASDRCRICDRVECRRRELSIAYYRLDDRGKPKRGKDAEWHAALEALAPVADECARLKVDWRAEALDWRSKATAPPAIPADLRALLEEQRRLTRAVHDDVEDEEIREAWHDALEEVNAWTRAHAGAASAPLTDDELAAMWRLRIGTSPSPNGMTIMRAIRDHAGGGR